MSMWLGSSTASEGISFVLWGNEMKPSSHTQASTGHSMYVHLITVLYLAGHAHRNQLLLLRTYTIVARMVA